MSILSTRINSSLTLVLSYVNGNAFNVADVLPLGALGSHVLFLAGLIGSPRGPLWMA